ncbi:MAG: VCBS repeat-containing protein [Myxococcota bacterium]
MRTLLPFLPCLLLGCLQENEITGKPEEPEFVEGDTAVPPDTDTDTDVPPDTGETAEPPPNCDDQYFAGSSVPQLDECFSAGPTVGTFTPEVLWDKQTFSNNGASVSCMMQPIVCPLSDDDGDGDADENDIADVVIITYSPGVLRALSGVDGSELWGSSGAGGIQITGGAACGDLDGDGSVEVIAATSTGVDVFDRHGNAVWSSSACSGAMDGTSDSPGIADMNADGEPEVIIGSCILDKDGALLGRGTYGWGSSANVGSGSFAVDIDQDGELEVVAGNAIYDISGNALWANGQADGYPAVGNFDEDDFGEIVVTGDARMRIQDDDGTVLCSAAIPAASATYGGPPTVADFDGDGEAEIGVAANSTYTVFETDCSVLWQFTGTTDPSSGNTGSSVFDFEGDGIADVVYADEHWVWVFDGRDGTVKMQDPTHSNNTWFEYPTVADINADGSADIAVCNTPGSWGSYNGVTVFQDADQSWRPGRRIWNQHGYSITNVEEDGSIPQYQETNWLSYNNFRSGDLTPGEGYSGPDLYAEILDICVDECELGNVTVWYAVGNQGYNDVEDDVAVEFWGDTDAGPQLLLATTWTADIVQGLQTASESVELTGVPTPLYNVWVTIDGGDDTSVSVVDECYEDNNVDEWGTMICP